MEKELKDHHHTIEHHELQIEEGMRPTTKSNEMTTEKTKWYTSVAAQKNQTKKRGLRTVHVHVKNVK